MKRLDKLDQRELLKTENVYFYERQSKLIAGDKRWDLRIKISEEGSNNFQIKWKFLNQSDAEN